MMTQESDPVFCVPPVLPIFLQSLRKFRDIFRATLALNALLADAHDMDERQTKTAASVENRRLFET